MKEIKTFLETGKIILKSNSVILNKEKLNVTDVKTFLYEQYKADKILESGMPYPLNNTFNKANKNLEKALELWESDRSKCLFHLLYLVQANSQQGRKETAEACTRCAIALIQEPLVPDLNNEKFDRIINVSCLAAEKSQEETQDLINLYQTYFIGTMYNAERFCPSIFDEKITTDMIKEDLCAYNISLQILQGELPYIH